MGSPWKGEPLRLTMNGATIPIWMGTPNSPPVMLFNFDQSNPIYAGYQPNLALNAPNTQILPPNFGLTMDGRRTIYVVGVNGAGPLQVTPGGGTPFQLSSINISTGGAAISEDASTPAVVTATGVQNPSATTAAFSPPAGSRLVVIVSVAAQAVMTSPGITVSDSGGHVWTQIQLISLNNFRVMTGIFTTYLTTAPGSITVNAVTTGMPAGANAIQSAVRVVNNTAVSQAGAGSSGTTGSSTQNTVAVTTTQQGSLVYVGMSTFSANPLSPFSGTTTINIDEDANTNCGLAAGKASALTATPGNMSFGWTQGASSGFAAVGAEILHA
jgi:hypothetical protein